MQCAQSETPLSFDPNGFVTLASELSAKRDSFDPTRLEAIVRTVIGRSYYGSFLRLREHLLPILNGNSVFSDQLKEMCEANTEIHGLIIDLMLVLDFQSGRRLDDLRQERNEADYELSPSSPMDADRADQAIQRATFVAAREFPKEERVEDKISKVTEVVLGYYEKYRKRRYRE